MFSRVRIAIRFFFMGLAVGVLLAPRSGKETRRMVRERADRLLNDLLDAATLGAFVLSFQDLDRLSLGFACVDHYWKTAFARGAKLAFEDIDLYVAW